MGRPKPLDPRSSLAAALGAKVRNLRVQRGWSQHALADRAYISPARVAQIELATDPPTEDLAEDLDRVLEANDEINIAWYHMNQARHPSWARPYFQMEQEATRMRKYAPQLVPGILQTPAYAYALLRSGLIDASEAKLQEHLDMRMGRKKLLRRSPPLHLWAVLDESVLLRHFTDGPAIMHEQLEHLLSVIELPNVGLQVMPFTAGQHGLLDGALSLIDFIDRPTTTYLPGLGTGGVEATHDVRLYETIFDQVMARALTPRETRDLIKTTMEERYPCPYSRDSET